MTAAAFLDRDGVINRKAPDGRYITTWAEFEFLPGVPEALRALRQHGMRLIVVTNQRGVALGDLSASDLESIHQRMNDELRDAGASLDAVLVCPHEKGTCGCRKPEIGLFLQAVDQFPDIRFDESVMVGDTLSDLIAGNRVGCRSFLVGDPAGLSETRLEAADQDVPIDGTARSLLELVLAGDILHSRPMPATGA